MILLVLMEGHLGTPAVRFGSEDQEVGQPADLTPEAAEPGACKTFWLHGLLLGSDLLQ